MNRLIVNADQGRHKISRHIYGHFSEHLGRCIYGGYWVGEDSPIANTRGIRDDIVAALRAIKIPNLRWPGGCFADEYHWMDGIGPREERPSMVNTHWGGVVENNHFGTHEFLDLCELLGCEPYICGNVGSGTVREMAQWVEYLNCSDDSPMARLRRKNGRKDAWNVRFFGVGNENWGCGGRMRPEYYADEYRRYAVYCREWSNTPLAKIACGPNNDNYAWTEVLMREAAGQMWGLALHYYTSLSLPGQGRTYYATGFAEDQWFPFLQRALRIEELIERHSAIMDRYDPAKRVALAVDEWGSWYKAEPGTNPRFLYQQNSLRDALIAGLHLNAFNRACDRVRMANIAQTVNVLQAMILTEDEKMILTPSYHVFDMWKGHQDATMLPIHLDCEKYEFGGQAIPGISASASLGGEGRILVTLCNLNASKPLELKCELRGATVSKAQGRILTAGALDAHNTFEAPDAVRPAEFAEFKIDGAGLAIQLPARSAVAIEALP
ncbi:MAG: Intracellular exo-alpha-L-arabinofuranosidase 2 [candidate division BRC1 bacterium ADurb.BinA364]|nr:MAG: Intracellular exo-alpha-L-arabinofuranosidase 2 [candidate division BRC1 bacterium ADurb.BinA364]